MPKITGVVDTCIVRVSDKWSYRGLSGRKIRIAGLLPASPAGESRDLEMARMKEGLLGKDIRIIAPHFVESGPVLIAELAVEAVSIEEFFGPRLEKHVPRERALETSDGRRIRRVKGHLQVNWRNPLATKDERQKPALGNLDYPVTFWLPRYHEQARSVGRLYCENRLQHKRDHAAVQSFLRDGTHKVMVLFGECGTGKSWFIRHQLLTTNHTHRDVAVVDISDFPTSGGAQFHERFQVRLSEVLGEFVNKREGGLEVALAAHLTREAAGVFPNRSPSDPDVARWRTQYLESLTSPANIETYNQLRLHSYGYAAHKLVLVVDNVDSFFAHDEQAEAFSRIVQAISKIDGVFIIVPMRPSTDFYAARRSAVLQHQVFTHVLSPPSMPAILNHRLSMSSVTADGGPNAPEPLDYDRHYYLDLLNRYLNSDVEKIISTLAGNDVRQYLRLFRRLIYSDQLGDLHNISSAYFGIAALMIAPGEGFREDDSYILNVFDNDHPNEIGNALVRWRVLEYFLQRYTNVEGRVFEYYFQRLGYDIQRVREVIDLWERVGALNVHHRASGHEVGVTACGESYDRLIRNLWYCIVIKSGMNISTDYILSGTDAVEAARDYGLTPPLGAEWVSDGGFLAFLAEEEELEEARLSDFPGRVPTLEESIRGVGPSSVHRELFYEYTFQLRSWAISRKRRRRDEA